MPPANKLTYPYTIQTTRYGTSGSKAYKHTLRLFNANLAFEVNETQRPSAAMIARCEAGNKAVWEEGTIIERVVQMDLPLRSQPRAATPTGLSR